MKFELTVYMVWKIFFAKWKLLKETTTVCLADENPAKAPGKCNYISKPEDGKEAENESMVLKQRQKP